MSVRKFYALGSSVCLVVSTLSSPLFAQAQDAILADEESLLFQDIPSVYSASKYDQKLTEAPSWVSIITAREIQQYGYRNMADILISDKRKYNRFKSSISNRFTSFREFINRDSHPNKLSILSMGKIVISGNKEEVINKPHNIFDNSFGSNFAFIESV